MPPHARAKCKTNCGNCYHCNLAVCSVCGAYEGSLTTDCPGTVVSFDIQEHVYRTILDYTDAKRWGATKSAVGAWPHTNWSDE